MIGWLTRAGEIIKDWWDRLTGRGRDDDEEEEEEEEEDDEEDEDDGEEEEDEEDEEEEEEAEEEEEGVDGEEDDDDYTPLLDLVREIEDGIDQNAEYLTNEELARTDELLEQLYELLAEYEQLDADDRNALIDLALEVLDELERIILAAAARADSDDSCSERRGPFATRDEAQTYAEEIPVPTWIYTDGLGWWWVCIEYERQAA